VVESGLGRAERYAEAIRDLGQRQADVVMEDEYGPLLEREPPEGSVELVAVVDSQDSVGLNRSVDREKPDVRRPPRAAPGLGVALVGQDLVQPWLESFGSRSVRSSRQAAMRAD
jgi:hypothetical protein